MTIGVLDLTDFLLARIAEDEAWAGAAIQTPGATHWHWMDSNTDVSVTVDPMLDEFIDYPENGEPTRVDLRTVEELAPVSWANGSPLPDFAVTGAEEVRPGVAGHIARHDPARVLAECEAKRQIVEMARAIDSESPDRGRRDVAFATTQLLALPYADHPDYREEWRP